jgi:hypothetical protein
MNVAVFSTNPEAAMQKIRCVYFDTNTFLKFLCCHSAYELNYFKQIFSCFATVDVLVEFDTDLRACS